MIRKWLATMALLSLFAAVAIAGILGRTASTTTSTIETFSEGTPALMTNIWTGYLGGSKEPMTLYGNSVEVSDTGLTYMSALH